MRLSCIALLLYSFTLYSQTNKLDSLWKSVSSATFDSAKIDATLEYALILNDLYPDSAKLFTLDALQKSISINYLSGISRSYNVLGFIYDSQGSYEEALCMYDKALNISVSLKNDLSIAVIVNNIGITKLNQGYSYEAEELIRKALKTYKSVNDSSKIAASYHILGVISISKSLIGATRYFEKSKIIYDALNDEFGLYNVLLGQAAVEGSYGEDSSSLAKFYNALNYFISINDKRGTATTLLNIGISYYYLLDSIRAENFLDKSLMLHTQLNDTSGIAETLRYFGLHYEALADDSLTEIEQKRLFQKAEFYTKNAASLYESIGSKVNLCYTNNQLVQELIYLEKMNEAYLLLQKTEWIAKEINLHELVSDTYWNFSYYYDVLNESRLKRLYARKARKEKVIDSIIKMLNVF